MRDWIVMTSSASMPSKVKSPYRHVAVVEVDDVGVQPKMISERAIGVRRITWKSKPLAVGKTERCAYQRGLATAGAIVARMRADHAEKIADLHTRLAGGRSALTDADMAFID